MPEGNALNNLGSIQGEAGNRKIQKKQGKYFGDFEVSKMTSKLNLTTYTGKWYIFCWYTKKPAENAFELLNILWDNLTITNCNYIQPNITTDSVTLEQNQVLHIILVKFPFSIKWGTLKQRTGTCFDDCAFITSHHLNNSIDEEHAEEAVKRLLPILFINNVKSINMDEEAIKESKFQNRQLPSQPSVKKFKSYD